MWGPNQGFEPLSKDSIRDPLTNCTILGPGYSSCLDHSKNKDNCAVAISALPRKQAKRNVLPPKRKLTIAMSEMDEDTDNNGNSS